MPGQTKSAPSSRSAPEPIVFEEALKKLESIVTTMETGDLPLEKMLGHYEEGVRLSQICQGKLAEAESKIEELEKNAAGDISLKRMSSQGEDNE